MKRECTDCAQMYNLFRHKVTHELHCAVPQDRAVPTFLDGTSWIFAGSFCEHALVTRFEIDLRSLQRCSSTSGTFNPAVCHRTSASLLKPRDGFVEH